MSRTETLRILLVEDNHADAEFVEDLLGESETTYFVVDIAETLSEALQRCAEQLYDVILLDLALPDSTGSDTFETVSSQAPDVPIIILTGLEDRALALELLRSGAQDYLVKGHFDYDLLARSIRYAIERIRAKHELNQRAEQLRNSMTMVDLANDSIIVYNLDYRITYWNEGARRLYGWTALEAHGKLIYKFLQTKFPQPLQEVKQTLFATGGWTGELTLTTRDQRNIIVESHQTLQRDVRGNPIAVFEINTDITDRKQAEEELKRYSQRLETLVEERTVQLTHAERLAGIGETAAMIGHDLRNPLQGLQYIVDLQKMRFKRVRPEERSAEDWATQEHVLDRISEQIFYMDKIVGDLQDYARPLQPILEDITLSALIDSVLNLIPRHDNVKILNSIPTMRIEADRHLMHRVFTNIVLNAMQAMPDGGTLSIDGTLENGWAVVSISDTGVGIPDQMRHKLFSPLITGKAKGTGLGLAVVKRIVDAHGGTITFESEKAKGTTFTVTLPRRVGG